MKSIVFDDNGLLFTAYTAAGTLQALGLGRVPLLVSSESFSIEPAPFPALISFRGPRPLVFNIGSCRRSLTPLIALHECRAGLSTRSLCH